MTYIRRLRVSHGDKVNDLEILLPPLATIEVLADVLGAAGSNLSIDGRALASWHSLEEAGVFDGVLLDIDRPTLVDEKEPPVVVVDQLAGLPGGDSRLLASGTLDFSPSPASDESFSLEISETGDVIVLPGVSPVVIDNTRIVGPTPLTDRILNVGSSRFRVIQLPPSDIPISPSDIPSDIPTDPSTTRQRARTAPVSTTRSVTPPPLPWFEPARFSRVWALSIPAVLALVVLGIVANRNFFVVLAVALAAAAAILLSKRKTRKKELRSHREHTSRLIGSFEAEVASARRSAERDLRQANPSIPELARAARGEVAGYWNRSRGDLDFAQVVVGYGEIEWAVRVKSGFQLPPVLQQIIENNGLLTSVPITADLAKGNLGIVGPRDLALPCARAIAVTLATQSRASDVRLSLAADESQLGDWDWLKWLPQLHPTHPIARSPDEADRMVSSWRTPAHDWLQVVIVDQPKWAIDQTSLLSILPKESGKQSLIIIADDIADLPDCETTVVIGSDGIATVTAGSAMHRFVSPVAAAEGPTDTIARGAARWHREFDDDPVGIAATGVRSFDLISQALDFESTEDRPPTSHAGSRANDTVSIAEPPSVIDLREDHAQPRREGKFSSRVGTVRQLWERRTNNKR